METSEDCSHLLLEKTKDTKKEKKHRFSPDLFLHDNKEKKKGSVEKKIKYNLGHFIPRPQSSWH